MARSESVSRRPTVRLDEGENGIVTITLDRPDALNAIDSDMVVDLDAALDAVASHPTRARCVVLTGAGRAFCAGGDISVHRDRPVGGAALDLADVLHHAFNPLLLRLIRLPIPFVTAINGAAAGAGLPLALAGDIVIAADSAVFTCGFQRIGLLPDLGATWLLPRLIGRARAHAMMLLDQQVSAATAVQWGLINEAVAADDLLARAMAVAGRLAASSVPAIVATRRLTLAAMAGSVQEALDAEAEAQRALGFGDDFAEGIRAFFDRRSPAFRDG